LTDADCGLWLQDLKAAAQALTARTGAPLHLWGVRTGALLAAALAADADLAVRQLLLWHPVLDGKIFVNQYLRLRLAAQVVNQGEKETTEQIRARLKAGEVLEVAAYPLTAALVDGLAASRLGDQIAGFKGRLALLEAASKGDQPLSVPARKLADALSAAGVDVDARSIQCPMIWQVHERVPAPTLSAETLALMEAAA
jgi:exosortase A-associated hydrolase 2